jgi:hypothetical protein
VPGGVDAGVAVAAVGGHRSGWPAGAAGGTGDGRGKLRRVGRVARFDGVVDDDAVVVVIDDLGLVAELVGVPEPAAADRPGVHIVQAHHAGGGVRHDTGEPGAGLGHHGGGGAQGRGQVVDGAAQPSGLSTGGRAQCAAGVDARVPG